LEPIEVIGERFQEGEPVGLRDNSDLRWMKMVSSDILGSGTQGIGRLALEVRGGFLIAAMNAGMHYFDILGIRNEEGIEPSGGTPVAKAIEFQKIVSSYINWWSVNYPQHGTTVNLLHSYRYMRGIGDYWACGEWSDALRNFLGNLDLHYYTIHQLNSPFDVPFPFFHSWIVLTSESGFIWLDPWLYGFWFGIELEK